MIRKNVLSYDPSVAVPFIAKWEGENGKPVLKAYLCPAKVWTIGFGHTTGVKSGMVINTNEAYDLLEKDLKKFQDELASVVHVPVTQNEFIALLSWIFNLGLTPAVRNSTLLKKLNESDYEGASSEFPKWRKSRGKVLDGLVNRRRAERELFDKKECGND